MTAKPVNTLHEFVQALDDAEALQVDIVGVIKSEQISETLQLGAEVIRIMQINAAEQQAWQDKPRPKWQD